MGRSVRLDGLRTQSYRVGPATATPSGEEEATGERVVREALAGGQRGEDHSRRRDPGPASGPRRRAPAERAKTPGAVFYALPSPPLATRIVRRILASRGPDDAYAHFYVHLIRTFRAASTPTGHIGPPTSTSEQAGCRRTWKPERANCNPEKPPSPPVEEVRGPPALRTTFEDLATWGGGAGASDPAAALSPRPRRRREGTAIGATPVAA
jgi:hypothetical protein